ncbi:hypothetical protein JCM6882_006230 [Rhodosporidiobolus microsporus]
MNRSNGLGYCASQRYSTSAALANSEGNRRTTGMGKGAMNVASDSDSEDSCSEETATPLRRRQQSGAGLDGASDAAHLAAGLSAATSNTQAAADEHQRQAQHLDRLVQHATNQLQDMHSLAPHHRRRLKAVIHTAKRALRLSPPRDLNTRPRGFGSGHERHGGNTSSDDAEEEEHHDSSRERGGMRSMAQSSYERSASGAGTGGDSYGSGRYGGQGRVGGADGSYGRSGAGAGTGSSRSEMRYYGRGGRGY